MKYIEGLKPRKCSRKRNRKEMYVKKEMRKKIIVFVVTLLLATGIPKQGVRAEEIYSLETTSVAETAISMYSHEQYVDTNAIKPITTMYDCDITMAFKAEGLVMDFSTACLGTASVVGVKDIKVQQKMWYGWKTMLISNGGENQNDSVYSCSITYEEAVKGKTYRVLCTHYANVDVYEEFENDTGAFKFTY